MVPNNASTNQVGGPDQSPQHPTGLRFSFCQIGDFCQVKTMQILRSRDKLFGKVYFSNPSKKLSNNFFGVQSTLFWGVKTTAFQGLSNFSFCIFFLGYISATKRAIVDLLLSKQPGF